VTQVLLVAGERAVAGQEEAVIGPAGLARRIGHLSGLASAWLPLARSAAAIALYCGTFQYEQ
jgi:hypothetical protein